MNKVVIILSHKSSGSSALQRLLLRPGTVNCIRETRHFQNESLYWTKAASVLNLPQQNMLGSEVPIPSQKARHDLIELLSSNLPNYKIPTDDTSLVFDGWRQLCYKYGPVFLEKSPHHLLQWSALELLLESMNQLSREIDFLLVGLVRNPMDMLYSAFRRWKTPPEALQYEWMAAYNNLRKLSNLLGDHVVIVRYEDLTVSLKPLMPVFEFCETSGDELKTLSDHALLKWKDNPFFGFTLASEVEALARSYDYSTAELHNTPHRFWPTYSVITRTLYHPAARMRAIYCQFNHR
ncbi:MAG: sulfotransferase [Cyanobacteria bacterium P01_D01_bin.1]